MIDLANDIGSQSYVLRHWKRNEDVVERLLEAGLSNIELCGVHYDVDDPKAFERTVELYRGKGVEIVSLGVCTIKGDEAEDRKSFELGKIAGVKFMSVNFPIMATPGAYRVAERLAEEYDVRLGIHNHGGQHWLGNKDTLTRVFSETNERIGLCLDTGWFIDARHTPEDMVRAFKDRLYGMHLKDFVYKRVRKPEDVALGEGLLDVPAFVAALREVDYDGFCVLEYEGDPENPVPALKRCVGNVRKAL